jgi:2-iminobutanoate/2-iminopropanoate deaminase
MGGNLRARRLSPVGAHHSHPGGRLPAATYARASESNGMRDLSASVPTAVETAQAPAPVGPYNQAVRVGDLLFCSGQIALDPASGELVGGGDVEAETRQVLANLKAVLAAGGSSPERVVRTTVFLADLADFALVNALYAEVFGSGVAPARACVQVAALPKGARVEIDAIATSA